MTTIVENVECRIWPLHYGLSYFLSRDFLAKCLSEEQSSKQTHRIFFGGGGGGEFFISVFHQVVEFPSCWLEITGVDYNLSPSINN